MNITAEGKWPCKSGLIAVDKGWQVGVNNDFKMALDTLLAAIKTDHFHGRFVGLPPASGQEMNGVKDGLFRELFILEIT